MAVKNYGIHDKWTNINKVNNVEIQSVDGVIENIKVNGEPAGGGDGFTKANVTVIGKAYTSFWGGEESTSGKPINGLLEYNNHIYSQIYMTDEKIGDTTFHTWILETTDEKPAFMFVELAGENPISVSGNCTLQNVGEGEYVVIFTGDCTITIS